MKVLYLGATWPQPWITAAGLRTVDLIKALKSLNYSIDFFSIKKPNPFQTQAIKVLDVNHSYMPLNDEKQFKSLTSSSGSCPNIALLVASKVTPFSPVYARPIHPKHPHKKENKIVAEKLFNEGLKK